MTSQVEASIQFDRSESIKHITIITMFSSYSQFEKYLVLWPQL